MQRLDRRAALGLLLGGAVAATGVATVATSLEAAPLPKADLPKLDGEGLVHDAQIYITRRRRRRWVCWRNRWGRRVCAWR